MRLPTPGQTATPPWCLTSQLAAEWTSSAYVHVCSNETINGVEYHELPDLKALGCDAPLVMDFSSHVASRPVDWTRIGLGIWRRPEEPGAGRADAGGGARRSAGPVPCPSAPAPSTTDWWPTTSRCTTRHRPYAIYMAGLVFKWLKRQGGIPAIEARNLAKANCCTTRIDHSSLYVNRVAKTAAHA
jgi:phosphoserine aminotransferase